MKQLPEDLQAQAIAVLRANNTTSWIAEKLQALPDVPVAGEAVAVPALALLREAEETLSELLNACAFSQIAHCTQFDQKQKAAKQQIEAQERASRLGVRISDFLAAPTQSAQQIPAPLTDEELRKVVAPYFQNGQADDDFALSLPVYRAIEAAHGRLLPCNYAA